MRNFLLLLIVLAISITNQAQVSINTTGANPDASAGLDVSFTNKGLLIPRVALTGTTDAVTVPTPATSVLVYNTGTGGLTPAGYYYNAGTSGAPNWVRFLTERAWMLAGNSGVVAPTSSYGSAINNDFIGTTTAIDFTFATNNFERMRIKTDATGTSVRIGIGTAYATAYPSGLSSTLLHIYDAESSASDFAQLQLGANKNTAGTKVGELNFHATTAATDRRTASIESYITAMSGLNPSGDIRFFTNNSATATFTEKMRIQGNGYVGIGTTAPTSQFHTTGTVCFANYPSGVNGAIVRTDASGNLAITNFSGDANQVLLGNNTFGTAVTSATAWQLTGNSGTTWGTNFIGTTDAQGLDLRTSNANRLRIDASGYVGVNVAPNINYQFYVSNASTTADNAAVYGAVTGNARVYGVAGSTTATTGNASGVLGLAAGATGATNGVWGQSVSSAGTGVYGQATHIDGDGVFALNSAAANTGVGSGIYAQTAQSGGGGVFGVNSNSAGTGIYGINSAAAGAGTTGHGIWGETAQSGSVGTVGMNTNSGGVGVYGQSSAAAGFGTGVVGLVTSPTGDGAYFANTAANGASVGFGAWAESNQTGGAAFCATLRSSGSYFSNTAISAFTASTIAGGKGVIGACDNATGVGVQGQTAGSSGTGVIGIASNATGDGAYFANTAANGASVGFGAWAESNQTGGAAFVATLRTSGTYFANTAISAITSSTITGGIGIIARCDNTSGRGVQGQSSGTSGIGVYGIAGGTVDGAGVYGGHTAGATGTGFTITNCRGAVKGQGAVTGSYGFGVIGSGGSSTRSGGVLGDDYNTARGALGYYSSGSVDYGVYAFGNYNLGAFGGKSDMTTLEENSYIGIGVYGGVMGGWFRGLKYGTLVKGESFSLYVDGKTYTNTFIAQLDNTNEGTRSPSYMTTSTSVDIIDKGVGVIRNGQASVSFNNSFSSVISDNIPVIVTITPIGKSKGIYLESVSKNGFVVKEIDDNSTISQNEFNFIETGQKSSNVQFTWIAIGTKAGYENITHSQELLSNDFDEIMDGVMFNDSDSTKNGTPIWWDGSQVRHDSPPASLTNKTPSYSEQSEFKTISSPALENAVQIKEKEIMKVNNVLLKPSPKKNETDNSNLSIDK